MSAVSVQKLCESTREKLKSVIDKMELFLNEHALPQLVTEEDEETLHFYRGSCPISAICWCSRKCLMRSLGLHCAALPSMNLSRKKRYIMYII